MGKLCFATVFLWVGLGVVMTTKGEYDHAGFSFGLGGAMWWIGMIVHELDGLK